ncbi:MAG: PH domain-containing protein [Brachybacterium sp.]|nr:PH domain-containing protein [Brachybacterium sp.]
MSTAGSGRPNPGQVDPGGIVHLRPHGATIITVLTWALCAALLIDALWRAGLPGLRVLPALAVVAAVIWAVLWAPRVVVREDAAEVRNILVTHVVPFASIDYVRIGAMLRLDVRRPDGTPATVTAWNAPSAGKDSPAEWMVRDRVDRQLDRGTEKRSQVDRGRRLAMDQANSRAAILHERWERWLDGHEDSRGELDAAARAADTGVRTRPNLLVIGVVTVCAAALALRIVLV